MCGADHWSAYGSSHRRGSPPRVRSRHVGSVADLDAGGITSACAEQTRTIGQRSRRAEDHLRVCGADVTYAHSPAILKGSPPRVRSRQSQGLEKRERVRITSACAEQTVGCCGGCEWCWDHLRVCGADAVGDALGAGYEGSPPRVRSKPPVTRGNPTPTGITSACAEQTQQGAAVQR